MIDVLMELEAVRWILGLGAICTALAVIYQVVVKPLRKSLRYIGGTYEHVMEYHDRLSTLEDRTAELVTNSGSSIKDAVNRIEFKQAGQTKMFNEHLEWSQEEMLKIWQTLAARDTVTAAKKTAELLEEKKQERGE